MYLYPSLQMLTGPDAEEMFLLAPTTRSEEKSSTELGDVRTIIDACTSVLAVSNKEKIRISNYVRSFILVGKLKTVGVVHYIGPALFN